MILIAGVLRAGYQLAAVAGSAVVHADDIAWWHSRFGWAGLLIHSILTPVHRGETPQISFDPVSELVVALPPRPAKMGQPLR